MPYIKPDNRKKFDPHVIELLQLLTETGTKDPKAGEVNYVVSKLVWELFDSAPSYHLANDLIGALECVKAEFYRRRVAPYEDKKIEENGDICVS